MQQASVIPGIMSWGHTVRFLWICSHIFITWLRCLHVLWCFCLKTPYLRNIVTESLTLNSQPTSLVELIQQAHPALKPEARGKGGVEGGFGPWEQ